MKECILPIFIFLFNISFGQKAVYTLNINDSVYSENQFKSIFEKTLRRLPDNYIIKPVIYHQVQSNDSIINYVSFVAQRKDSINIESKYEFAFNQDSLFLLLNTKLPEFILKDLNGNEFSSNQLLGKPTLLNFWSISCMPCILEIPELNMLKEKFVDKMNFIALTENTCSKDDLPKFLVKHSFNYYILQDAEIYKNKLKIGAIPKNIFIDKNGYIRYIQSNFPYTFIDIENGIRKYEEDNYFIKIIEKLIKNAS